MVSALHVLGGPHHGTRHGPNVKDFVAGYVDLGGCRYVLRIIAHSGHTRERVWVPMGLPEVDIAKLVKAYVH